MVLLELAMQLTDNITDFRAPGSIGAASYPARVFKGMRMAGQMGNARVKVENLQVMRVMSEKNIMIVKGAVPGAKNSYIIIEK